MKGTKVYYQLHIEGSTMMFDEKIEFTPNVTHVQVALCPSEWGKEEIFAYFNIGDGITESFANKIRSTPDLHHTSMSIGDVIMTDDNKVYVCSNYGWNELTHVSKDFREIWR
jgi:hypothetical protein